jgi:steroid delta-isomerase-like uncharacterized protein
MDARDVAQRWFDAWNSRDLEAIAAVMADDGTYADPMVPDGLGPQETAGYAGGLFAAFPDLGFTVEGEGRCGEGTVLAEWRMRGTNGGSFNGLPPTGRAIDLPGADVIRVEGDRIRSVRGYFDSAVVPRQLGLQVVVQPDAVGPFRFGVVGQVSTAGTRPGAVSLTVLEARTPEQQAEVRDRSRDVVLDVMGEPGFISWLGVVVGERMYTITAWETPEAAEALRRSPAHREAMDRFLRGDLAAGGQTGVWAPHRLNGLWGRCGSCGRMGRPEEEETCPCGAASVVAVPYW